jgi:O-antigen ligase
MGLFIYEKSFIKSAAWLTAALFDIWVLIDNNTFGCYIAVFVGLVAFAFIFIAYEKSKKFNIKTIIPIISFVLLSACLMPFYNIGKNFFSLNEDISKFADEDEDTSTAGSGRWTLWVQTAELIKNKPVFGYGPEGLSGKFTAKVKDSSGAEQIQVSFQDRPHNEYLQHAAFMGIPALVFYLAALIMLFFNRIKNIKNVSVIVLIAGCAVIGYAVSAFFGNTMYYTTPFFFILLGMTANASQTVKPD